MDAERWFLLMALSAAWLRPAGADPRDAGAV